MDLKTFADKNLFNAETSFFKQLDIRLNSSSTSFLPLKNILKNKFKPQDIFEKVSEAYFVFTCFGQMPVRLGQVIEML